MSVGHKWVTNIHQRIEDSITRWRIHIGESGDSIVRSRRDVLGTILSRPRHVTLKDNLFIRNLWALEA